MQTMEQTQTDARLHIDLTNAQAATITLTGDWPHRCMDGDRLVELLASDEFAEIEAVTFDLTACEYVGNEVRNAVCGCLSRGRRVTVRVGGGQPERWVRTSGLARYAGVTVEATP